MHWKVDCSSYEPHLVKHLYYGAPTHIIPVLKEMHTWRIYGRLERRDVRLGINMDEKVGIRMKRFHKPLELRRIGMRRYKICYIHFLNLPLKYGTFSTYGTNQVQMQNTNTSNTMKSL